MSVHSDELDDLYNNAPCGYHSLDAEGRIIRINNTELQWLGYVREEVIGKRITEFMAPATVEKFPDIFAELKRDGILQNIEVDFLRRDGSLLPVLVNATAIRDSNGEFIASRSSIIEIAERKRTEEALQESRQRFSALSDASFEGILIQEKGVILAANQAIANFFEVESPSELIGKNGFEILPLTAESKVKIREATLTDSPAPYEITVIRKDGTSYPAEAQGRSMSYMGRPVRVVAMRNITERKQAELHAAREHARTQQVLDTVHTLIVGIDITGCISIINRAGCELLRRSENELLGKMWFSECLPQPHGIQTVYPRFLEVVSGQRLPSDYFEEEIVCADGSLRVIACSNSYMRDEAGSIIGTLISGEDITDRLRREEEQQMLVRLQKERRILEWRNELMRLTQINVGSAVEIVAELLPAITQLLKTEYASYWIFDEHQEQITCVRQFSRSQGIMLTETENAVLRQQDYPEYFAYLIENRTPLSAPDAMQHPITSLLSPDYFIKLRVRALLDIPVWHRGGIRGVLCIEDIEQPRNWSVEEIEFVESAGRVMTFLLESLDRRATQMQLSQSEVRFSTVFSGSSLPMLILEYSDKSEAQIIVEVNPSFEETFGIRCEDAIGKTPIEISGGLFDERVRRTVETELAARNSLHNLQFNARIADGSIHLFLVSASVISYSDKPHILVIMQDIQEQKEAEAKMEEARRLAESANRAKSEFLANISHEIRTPMNAILGFAEILRKQKDDDRREKYIDAIIAGGTTLMALINDILDLSKIESGGIQLTAVPQYIRSLMDGIQVVFRSKMEEKNLEFNIVIEDTVPALLVFDGTRLRQILYHILGNAVKFTEQGKVTIRTRVESETQFANSAVRGRVTLVVEVSDTGVGIAAEEFTSIFEAFRQQEGGSARKYSGAGLGLTITKRLIEAMGGTISVQSNVNVGSTFIITLPNVEAWHEDMPIHPHNNLFDREKERLPSVLLGITQEIGASVINNNEEKARLAEYAISTTAKYHDRWILLSNINTMSKNKRFAQDLLQDARLAAVAPMEEYAGELFAACERFDVARVKELMNGFPVLLGKLARK